MTKLETLQFLKELFQNSSYVLDSDDGSSFGSVFVVDQEKLLEIIGRKIIEEENNRHNYWR